MSHQFQPGDTVYGKRGNVGTYYAKGPGLTHLVQERLESGDEVFDEEEASTWTECYAHPVTQVIEGDITALEQKKESARKELLELNAEVRTKVAERNQLLDKLAKRLPSLRRIEEFIEGTITHYVEERYDGLRIITKEQTKVDDRYDHGFRLLSLFGRTNGDLEWKLSEYSEGSGSKFTVWPFVCESDAIAYAQQRQLEIIEAWRSDLNRHIGLGYMVASCKRVGIEVPEDVRAYDRQQSLKTLEAQKDKLVTDLSKIERLIKAVGGEEGA